MSAFVRKRHGRGSTVPAWAVAIQCGMLLWWLPVIVAASFIWLFEWMLGRTVNGFCFMDGWMGLVWVILASVLNATILWFLVFRGE